ncbi:hypothetical protein BD310DRAFT_443216 [Dichomitus squalens]|uniref:Uncharacterized protein n=1 Tax=Dichomitus squalens TaxID=114155 RepID=A0A4Q9PW06_9APHY|nr:hypothetical protein BD310DRAFT_443216 [Dichomitus squalens]
MPPHPCRHLLCISCCPLVKPLRRIHRVDAASYADIFLRLVLTALDASQRRSATRTTVTLNIPAHQLRQARRHLSWHYASSKDVKLPAKVTSCGRWHRLRRRCLIVCVRWVDGLWGWLPLVSSVPPARCLLLSRSQHSVR